MSHAAILKRFPKHRNIKYLENGLHRHATHVLLKYTSTGGYAKNPYLQQHPGKLRQLAYLLGHESLDTTAIYTRPSPDDLADDLESCYAELSLEG